MISSPDVLGYRLSGNLGRAATVPITSAFQPWLELGTVGAGFDCAPEVPAPGFRVRATIPRRITPPPNKKRRVVAPEELDPVVGNALRRARYGGSPHHKSKPADYDFIPPTAPLDGKSLCDHDRPIKLKEAIGLFKSGIRRGMVSGHLKNGLPAFVWSVDEDGQAYEAKPGDDGRTYHGYPLYKEVSIARYIRQEWKRREETSDA